MSRVRTALRGAAAGAGAATAWSALEPVAARVIGTTYTDVRLLGRLVSPGRWAVAGSAVHAANGAAFGALFALAGRRGPRAGLLWTGVETLATWPGMALMDRVHPDRRSGHWPDPLISDRRVFAQEAVMHAVFGLLLGAMLREDGSEQAPAPRAGA